MRGDTREGPAHQAGLHYGENYSGKYVDINPLNQEAYPNQKPSPDQPFSLPTKRQVHWLFFLTLRYTYQLLNCLFEYLFLQFS